MSQEYQDRDEDMGRTTERILILARNVLNVPVDPDLEKRPDNDASIHDQVSNLCLTILNIRAFVYLFPHFISALDKLLFVNCYNSIH